MEERETDGFESSEEIVDKFGGYRNKNNAWVPGWRYASCGEAWNVRGRAFRITTPLFEISRQGNPKYGNRKFQFKFWRNKDRRQGEGFFCLAVVLLTGDVGSLRLKRIKHSHWGDWRI